MRLRRAAGASGSHECAATPSCSDSVTTDRGAAGDDATGSAGRDPRDGCIGRNFHLAAGDDATGSAI